MKSILSCLMIVIILAAGGWLLLNLQFEKSNAGELVNKNFVIIAGQGLEEITANLQEQGLLSRPVLFKVYAALKDRRAKFKTGEYQLNTQMSIKELTAELTKDKPARREVKVQVIEGWNNQQIIELTHSLGLFSQDEFLNYLDNNRDFAFEFLTDRASGAGLEGYLYPDTYLVFDNAKPVDLVGKMLKNFDDKLTNELRQEINRQGKTIYEVLTLASIVEKEMFGVDNRRLVAGIFLNRLADNYPLQSDATVNYITQKGTTRPSLDDTKIDNPYNTYQNAGLPPGPICNPSIEAIKAVIYPADTDYYFFLTTPDNEIIYSRTHEEHIANRNKYLGS